MTKYFYILLISSSLCSCSDQSVTIQHGALTIEFNQRLHSRVFSNYTKTPLTDVFSPSEYLELKNFTIQDFQLTNTRTIDFADGIGSGKRFFITGKYQEDDVELEKLLQVTVYDSIPDQVFFVTKYINKSGQPLEVERWVNHHYILAPNADSIPFWSFQGESTGARSDWVLPINAGFYQRNFMGMNNTDYGGGIPVIDLWRRDGGIAIGHAETVPKLVSLPVEVRNDDKAVIQIEKDFGQRKFLQPGDTLRTIETFVSVHKGDFYQSLSQYGSVLRKKGIVFPEPVDAAFEASWCAWGYMRDFTVNEILGTIPKVKELGIKWATIDDGYQQCEGDWHVNTNKFPKGDGEMKRLVSDLHAQGLKVMLWWAPLAADPHSKLLATFQESKSLTADGAPHYITWWDSYYLAPSHPATIAHTKEILKLFFTEWGVDGLKMDGQHLNAVHPNYAPGSGLHFPEEAFEKLPQYYDMVYKEANRLKPGAVMQLCPCGTCMSVFNMPFMNQAVASDPLSSWQVRLKGKTYKALIPDGAYFGDHVELSDGRNDFASSLGVGAVLGTKFTWPKENPSVKEQNLLTPEKMQTWKKWFDLYENKFLSKAKYIGGLYDIGYDRPETHVIAKGDTLHYAFYAKSWEGEVELRGLTKSKYKVRDYVNNVALGDVSKNNPKLNVKFNKNLLVEVYPVQ